MTAASNKQTLQIINSPYQSQTSLLERLDTAASGHCHFALALGATALSDVDGISAAGSTASDRRLTAKLDADILYQSLQKPQIEVTHPLPTSPRGITSPVVITSASLGLINNTLAIYDCGTFAGCAPTAPHIVTPGQAAARPAQGAMPLSVVRDLFDFGLDKGSSDHSAPLTCLAECVPGGTSTAALVLTLLGIDALAMGSSSLPDCGGDFKTNLLKQELDSLCRHHGKDMEQLQALCQSDPLQALVLAGDPVQAFACGYLMARARSLDSHKSAKDNLVVAAGGTQMLAIWTLMDRLTATRYKDYRTSLIEHLAIITTSYVAYDPHARVRELAILCQAPFISIDPGLEQSSHPGLKAYVEGNVKEGVGAGAAFAIASRHHSQREMIDAIDQTYSRLVGVTA